MITFSSNSLLDAFDELFGDIKFNNFPQTKTSRTSTEYRLYMALPGLKKDQIKVSIKERSIEFSYSKDEKSDSPQFVESFSKRYLIPSGIKNSEISAKFEDGILEICLPFEKENEIDIPIK